MASSKKPESSSKKPIIDPKKALKDLKSLKLPTFTGGTYDARKPLTKWQKENIRKTYKKYQDIITAPKSEYKVKDLSKYSKKEIDLIKSYGYNIVNKKAYIDLQGKDKATLTKKIKGGKSIIEITRSTADGRKKETEIIVDRVAADNWRTNLIKQYERGNFKKGDFIGVKINDGGYFRNVMVHSMDKIFAYLEDDFSPKDDDTNKDDLLNKMVLVRLRVTDYRDLPLGTRDRKGLAKVARKKSTAKKARYVSSNTVKGKVKK